ncbi:MAG: hypothetical protein EOO46_09710 [Flavobacterium sp.]|nr:MAG: hypothetical protein EOO46_09710 [Flavobacterium sp.]
MKKIVGSQKPLIIMRKYWTAYLITLLLLVSCQKKSEKVYVAILDSEFNDSKTFLTENLSQVKSAIEDKVSDYPYLKSSYDSLNVTNDRIDYALLHLEDLKKDKSVLISLKSDLETNSKLSFIF